MLHTPTEKLPMLPLIFGANVTGDPEVPPGEEGDPPPPGGGDIKPPTVNQPSSESEAGAPESNPQAPSDDDIIIKGG